MNKIVQKNKFAFLYVFNYYRYTNIYLLICREKK